MGPKELQEVRRRLVALIDNQTRQRRPSEQELITAARTVVTRGVAQAAEASYANAAALCGAKIVTDNSSYYNAPWRPQPTIYCEIAWKTSESWLGPTHWIRHVALTALYHQTMRDGYERRRISRTTRVPEEKSGSYKQAVEAFYRAMTWAQQLPRPNSWVVITQYEHARTKLEGPYPLAAEFFQGLAYHDALAEYDLLRGTEEGFERAAQAAEDMRRRLRRPETPPQPVKPTIQPEPQRIPPQTTPPRKRTLIIVAAGPGKRHVWTYPTDASIADIVRDIRKEYHLDMNTKVVLREVIGGKGHELALIMRIDALHPETSMLSWTKEWFH